MLTKKELMQELKISQSTVQKWVNEGMPCLKKGTRFIRFDLEKVKEWLIKKTEE